MARSIISFAVLALVLVAFAEARAEPFEDGVHAYDQGDFAGAKAEFEGLVEIGHAGAEAMLGVMYFNGQGVPEDRFIAAIYFYKSARRGNPDAQLALGSLYIQGIGVRANTATAYKWVSLAEKGAAGQLSEAAKQLKEQLAASLTEAERQAADKKISAWKPVWPSN